MNTHAAALRGTLRSSSVQDAGLAVLLLIGTWAGGGNATPAVGICLVAVAVRRRWPIPALIAASVASVTQMAQGVDPVASDLAVPVILYTIAAHRPFKASFAWLGAVLAVTMAWSLYVSTDGKTDGVAPGVGGQTMLEAGERLEMFGPTAWGGLPLVGSLLTVAWAIGWGMRSRRAAIAQRAELAVAAERARITREVHDVVAHGLAVIVVQAQGGAAALAKRPDDTRAALDTIVATGRASLLDLRHVLSGADESGEPDRPVAGLAQLSGLVDQVRQAGTPVQLQVSGSSQPVPTSVDVSSYRIVQEALTNTMKHAGADACARVVVTYAADAVRLEVIDDGVGRSASAGIGNGLRGMRERVALLGGELDTGPGPDGGYVVRARIPLDRRTTA